MFVMRFLTLPPLALRALTLIALAFLSACVNSTTVATSRNATVYRVSPDRVSGKIGVRTFHSFPVLAGPRRASEENTLRLAMALGEVYDTAWDANKRCRFSPRYGVTLGSAPTRVDVLICPGCEEVRFYRGISGLRRSTLGAHKRMVVAILERILSGQPWEFVVKQTGAVISGAR